MCIVLDNNMNIQKFIFNWKGYANNTREILSSIPDALVINSDDTNLDPLWINLDDSAYFTTQFLKALELFNGDILFHIQADVKYNNWQSLMNDAIDDYTKYRWGIYAPNINWTAWDSIKVDKQRLPDNRKIVKCTDCTVWMIDKQVIDYFLSMNYDLSDNLYGWGIDLVLITISNFLGLPVIRNYNHTIYHSKNRGYKTFKANKMMSNTLDKIPNYLRPFMPNF